MKKYMKFIALCAVVALGGYTKADAGFLSKLQNKVMNAVDECNAGAGGSPKALKEDKKGVVIAEKCIGSEELAMKNKNFAEAYWFAHCNAGNAGGDGDYGSDNTGQTDGACFFAFSSLKAPAGITGCNDASSQAIAAMEDPKEKKAADAWLKKMCIDNPKQLAKAKAGANQDADELAAATDWQGAHCGDDMVAADKKSFALVKKVVPVEAAG